ncbi:MAG: hypothetical protein JNM88_08710 [Chitinophagaceae bacterium]|nr:hypothetical protein [Chitinophagaceae bacterium]
MKKILLGLQVLLFCLFNAALLATIVQLSGVSGPFDHLNYKKPEYNNVEEYDPSLQRINSSTSLITYCDSLYNSSFSDNKGGAFERHYADIVSSVIRKRFYHGYSHYSVSDNYLSVLFSRATLDGYSAIVIPEDILKHPNAACSQQSIVMMDVLKRKGLQTRKVGFSGKTAGHFCFEVYYDGGWHFYDTNMEPDVALLNAHNRPDIATLVNDKELLLKAYSRYPKEKVLDVFSAYSYGTPNAFSAPRGLIFQKAAKFLSYTLWIFFLTAFIIVRRKYLRLAHKKYVRNSRIYLPQPEQGTSPSYYPGITAPGA